MVLQNKKEPLKFFLIMIKPNFSLFFKLLLLSTSIMYSCNSAEIVDSVTKNKVTTQNNEQIIFEMTHEDYRYQLSDKQESYIIDKNNGKHPINLTFKSTLILKEVSKKEAVLIEKKTKKEYAKIEIKDIQKDFYIVNVLFHNGKKLENIKISTTTLGWGKWSPVVIEAITEFFEYINEGETILNELVIYDMRGCYTNHKIAIQNCVGGSLTLIANAATGECIIGNCVR